MELIQNKDGDTVIQMSREEFKMIGNIITGEGRGVDKSILSRPGDTIHVTYSYKLDYDVTSNGKLAIRTPYPPLK